MPGKVKWLWSINGSNSNVDTSNLVTINGTQTISGSKTFTAETTINNVLHMGNHIIDQVANPTNPQNAATKDYVDNHLGNNYTKIYTVSNISNLGVNFSQVLGYTNMNNNFRIENGSVYNVLFKQNTESKDVYTSCIVGVNNANYDNCGITGILPWGNLASDSIIFAIVLKNNQFKLSVKRGYGTGTSTTSWNTQTQIFIRKIANGTME